LKIRDTPFLQLKLRALFILSPRAQPLVEVKYGSILTTSATPPAHVTDFIMLLPLRPCKIGSGHFVHFTSPMKTRIICFTSGDERFVEQKFA